MNERTSNEEVRVGTLLRARGATVATAESCTGGLIGSLLTDVSGSSDYYLGGVISYSNQVKRDLLGVRAQTLATVGAVSRETALQMAHGVRRLLGVDYALSVTGIAGPTGGTAEKPVGLVYIALVGPGVERCERHVWDGDRQENKMSSARRALHVLIEHFEGPVARPTGRSPRWRSAARGSATPSPPWSGSGKKGNDATLTCV